MFARTQVALLNTCADFKRNSEGSVVSIFALALIPLFGLVGAAVDYSIANNARTSLQASLDAALVAGARDGSTSWASTALDTFNANLVTKGATDVTPDFQLTSGRAYTGTVTAKVPSHFLGVMGISNIDIRVSGTSTVPPSTGGYYCVMALNPNAQAALQLTGNASIKINAPKCVVQVNSNNSRAVEMNGNTWIQSVENCSSAASAPSAIQPSRPHRTRNARRFRTPFQITTISLQSVHAPTRTISFPETKPSRCSPASIAAV